MAVDDQLGRPPETSHQMGRFSLNRIVRCDADAAVPVVWTNLNYVVQIEIGRPTWKYTADMLHQGAGDEITEIKRGPRWDGTITVLSGNIGNVLASLKGVTWNGSHVVLSSRNDSDDPQIIWEAIARDADNKTHLFSLVIQDMIIDDLDAINPMDYSDRTIAFHTYHEWFLVYTGYEMVYDVWDATPTTATYTISAGTPETLLTATNHDDWHYDNAVYVKNKDNSASDTGMTRRIISNVTVVGAVLTFTTGTPATSDKIGLLYAKATS